METLFKINSYSEFEQVAEEIINNLYYTSKPITFVEQSVLDEAKNDLRNIIFSCNFDISKVKEILQQKNLDQDKTKCLTSILENKQNALLLAALNYYNSSHGDIVTDNEWSIKLIFGTSELKTLRYPLLQLTLQTVDSKGEIKKNTLDLKKEILLKFIEALKTVCDMNT